MSHPAKPGSHQLPILAFNPEVKAALQEGLPVVALESTIICHGMPYPENLANARDLEAVIRKQGAIPATIAIMSGKIKIGLTEQELCQLAETSRQTPNPVQKVSRRDLARVLARREWGATTVSGTLLACQLAGIKFFATGGIGGVHRNPHTTWDISNDLSQLAQSEVCVVCAGAKSILDIPKTLEALETLGVPVAIWQSSEFPAFYHGKSGQFMAPAQVADADAVAQQFAMQGQLGLAGGLLLACPIPAGAALDPDETARVIAQALEQAAVQNITGKDTTPFLLAELNRNTAGRCLEANRALVKNNATIAADVAKAYSQLLASQAKSLTDR